MPQCIAAVFKTALKPLRALLCPPKGRHSAGQLRRRRSTRVRRYAPGAPAAPIPLPSQPAAQRSQVNTDERPRPKSTGPKPPTGPEPSASSKPTTVLKPPAAEIDADDIALVRPYFTAHEADAEAERVRYRSTARLRAWGADLESGPVSVFELGLAPAGTRAYTLDEFRDPDPDPVPDPGPVADPAPTSAPEPPAGPDAAFHVPAPRPPSPRLPARMNDLPHLSRIRARQQQRRTTVSTGVSA
ncbi:hypothetical protein [Nocardiopsis xinjiangensis]|uniref:hypothetical protein n=1 Tax=Nocardiopsis xinjiangensis TaxID=124285 RepID=UPI000346DE50|nr:hypothetical protein [Nocardiopsis xinjiangensis]